MYTFTKVKYVKLGLNFIMQLAYDIPVLFVYYAMLAIFIFPKSKYFCETVCSHNLILIIY